VAVMAVAEAAEAAQAKLMQLTAVWTAGRSLCAASFAAWAAAVDCRLNVQRRHETWPQRAQHGRHDTWQWRVQHRPPSRTCRRLPSSPTPCFGTWAPPHSTPQSHHARRVDAPQDSPSSCRTRARASTPPPPSPARSHHHPYPHAPRASPQLHRYTSRRLLHAPPLLRDALSMRAAPR